SQSIPRSTLFPYTTLFRSEVEEIANNSEAPTFENTIVAMEKSGRLLSRAASVFYNLASAHTNDQIQEIQKEMAPKLAAHSDNILDRKSTRLNSSHVSTSYA